MYIKKTVARGRSKITSKQHFAIRATWDRLHERIRSPLSSPLFANNGSPFIGVAVREASLRGHPYENKIGELRILSVKPTLDSLVHQSIRLNMCDLTNYTITKILGRKPALKE